jgi:hypothetical protein
MLGGSLNHVLALQDLVVIETETDNSSKNSPKGLWTLFRILF